MKKLKRQWRLVLHTLALTLVFAVCEYLGISPAIEKSIILLVLMLVFFYDHEPLTLAIYGAFGLVYIGLAGLLNQSINSMSDYIQWGVEMLAYVGIYTLFWLFSKRLKRLNNISTLHELVIAGTTAGLWKWGDMDSDEQWWSPRYYQLLGYENNEIPASLTNLRDLIHPDDREATFKVLQDYIDGKRSDLEYEYRIRTKSGEYKWFLGSGEVQFERASRRPRRIVGSIVDINHKKQHQITLAYQAALVGMSPDAIITTDLLFNIQSWNEGAERLYDIKAEDALGKSIRELINTSYPYSTEEQVIEEFNANGQWRGEAHQLTKKGKKVYVLSSVKKIQDANGELTGVMAINSDISLLRINTELSAALKMLESSTEYIEQLAYISSHDLKSPIITLQGLMNHLAAAKAIAPGHEATFEMLREIVENMKSTSIALTTILQLRKNLTSREFATDKVYVAQVVKDVQEMLRSQITATGAQINVAVEKGLQIRIHNSFLRSMLYNLVGNSIKFRQPGRAPIVGITANVVNNSICIVISDNGSGINLSRYQNKLFTIFARFNDETEGNGIGLHSVKMIVDFYKGDIHIDSAVGEGTVITIKLPIDPDE